MNKWYIIGWVIVAIATFLITAGFASGCYDGYTWDEDKLMGLCNVNIQGLVQELKNDPSFCPDEFQARIPAGRCDVYWDNVIYAVIGISIAYNLIYFFSRKIKK